MDVCYKCKKSETLCKCIDISQMISCIAYARNPQVHTRVEKDIFKKFIEDFKAGNLTKYK